MGDWVYKGLKCIKFLHVYSLRKFGDLQN